MKNDVREELADLNLADVHGRTSIYSLTDCKLADFNLAVCYRSANPPN